MSNSETEKEKRIREKIGFISRADVLAAIRSIKHHGVCHHSKIQRFARCNLIRATLLIEYLQEVGIVGGRNYKAGGYKVIADVKGLCDE